MRRRAIGAIRLLKLFDPKLGHPVIGVSPATHTFKYSLFYGRPGQLGVLLDSERGKGDHCHFGEVESAYRFETPEKLIEDFKDAVRVARKEGR
jgi:hypothetical protein